MANFYITTPIYYVNGDPHLGTAYAEINADAFARWHRLLGDQVRFVTGTDEHGLKIAQAAAEHGVTPQEWVDRTSERFRGAWGKLDISFDDFIRTTEPRHVSTVQEFLSEIYRRGYIYKDLYVGLYCISCEAYYQESELVDGKDCPVHGRPVTEMSEENYFFALSKFNDRLIEFYENNPGAITPETRLHEVLGFLRQGLTDISITRSSIDWGVSVPWDEQHVFYVWYDALINYLTAVGYGDGSGAFEQWWPSVHHLLGKDILRFHAVWWPAMCMAAGIDPPAHFLVTGWMLVNGEKMSKSLGNQIDPMAVASDLSSDALRYYLLRANGFGLDGDVSLESLYRVYNADLANDLGNLVSRVVALSIQKGGGRAPAVPEIGSDPLGAKPLLEGSIAAWNAFRPMDAIDHAMAIVRAGNSLLERAEPWRRPEGDAESLDALGRVREGLRLAAVLLSPAIPKASLEIFVRLGFGGAGELRWTAEAGGATLEKRPPLFPRAVAG